MNGFENFGQFARNDQGSITKDRGHVVDGFQNPMRRFVEDQRAGILAQLLERQATLPALGWQKSVKQKVFVEQA